MREFDASIPRKMFWSYEIENGKVCPECGSELESEHHHYLPAVRQGGDDIETFLAGNDNGCFCPNCPVVVLDFDAFGRTASLVSKRSESFTFLVAGMIDLNAIPEERKHLPFGGDDNPVPVTHFTNLAKSPDSEKTRWNKRRGLIKKRKRRR